MKKIYSKPQTKAIQPSTKLPIFTTANESGGQHIGDGPANEEQVKQEKNTWGDIDWFN